MPDPQSLPANRRLSSLRLALESVVILLICLGSLGWDLATEPHFVDESAYISQSFYGDLFVQGRWNHPAWLDYGGYDLPPLPKYLIGLALWSKGDRRPTLADAHAWYGNTSRQFVTPSALTAARIPSVVLGSLGCLALFWLGCITVGVRVGVLAAGLLALNPLYRMHARRAMSDIPAECFLLLALVCGAIAWRQVTTRASTVRSWLLVVGAGGLVGLATLSKLNGVLAGLVLLVWIGVGIISPAVPWRGKWFLVIAAPIAAGVGFATFVVGNPFLIAHPPEPVAREYAPMARLSFLGRCREIYDHRATVSRLGMQSFPHNALPTLGDRIAAVGVQGFGRFGSLGPRGWTDSTIRYDWVQDWGAILWLPCVVGGLILVARRGWQQWHQRVPPMAWLVLTYGAVVGVVVTSFVPLAWDRYFLSIQAPAALLGSVFVVAVIDRCWPSRLRSVESAP